MPLSLDSFDDVNLDGAALASRLADHEARVAPVLARLWSYYRNETTHRASGPASCAQRVGLPARLRGGRHPVGDDRGPAREVVIENDIAWRVDALVDFVFGKPLRLSSTAVDERTRLIIDAALDACWEASGGTMLLQDAALLGAVHGTVDLVVRADALLGEGVAGALRAALDRAGGDEAALVAAARAAGEMERVEAIDAPRGVAVTDPADAGRMEAFAVWSRSADAERPAMDSAPSVASRLWSTLRGVAPFTDHAVDVGSRPGDVVEVFGATRRELHVDGELVFAGEHGLDELPVVRVPNRPVPFGERGGGVSEVEPLIPLQDELNTRLSDRAHRVTMQSFRMYLAKGSDGFGSAAVGPGQIWSTDNPDAEVRAFGGDVYTPSESEHIQQVRDAMDKLSGVSPLVLGLLRARIGHLSSENALRVTLMGVLSKAERKRLTYGRGISRASRLVLKALARAGVLDITEADTGVRIHWPDPLPTDEQRVLQAARLKLDVGVPRERVLDELGYEPTDPGVL